MQRREIREGGAGGATVHSFRRLADTPINGAHFGENATFIDYSETKPEGGTSLWTWATDPKATVGNSIEAMRCARRRRAIENEAFKALKSIGSYNFEHNFGRGHQRLPSVLATLATPARQGRRLYLRRKPRSIFFEQPFPDRPAPWLAMARGRERASLKVLDGYWPLSRRTA